jgi:hypothetical protein
MIKFTVEIVQQGQDFIASSEDASGGDHVFQGVGLDPYEALYDLVSEFREADLYRPD